MYMLEMTNAKAASILSETAPPSFQYELLRGNSMELYDAMLFWANYAQKVNFSLNYLPFYSFFAVSSSFICRTHSKLFAILTLPLFNNNR